MCSIFFVYTAQTFSQVKIDSTEITSSVPELTEFHRIIYPMWHRAYPAKDIDALKGFVTEIKISMDKINHAMLPGILKDKEVKWKNQMREKSRYNNPAHSKIQVLAIPANLSRSLVIPFGHFRSISKARKTCNSGKQFQKIES